MPQNNNSGNQYDKIFKENIGAVFLPLVQRCLGIIIVQKEVLLDKFITTTEREVDSLYKIKVENGKELILHIEIQTRDDKGMIYRVGEYHGLILRKYKLPIKHIVIYLGERPSKMQDVLKKEEIFSGFELLSISELETAKLLASDVPEEVLLAILSHYEKEQSKAVIQTILIRLSELCKNKNNLKKYTSQLTILSKLRKLELQTVKQIRNMPILFDIKTSILFQEGREEGLEEGVDRGKLMNQLIVVANMLTKSELGTIEIALLAEVEEQFVLDIKEKLDSEEWTHPETWTEEEWNIYFDDVEQNTPEA